MKLVDFKGIEKFDQKHLDGIKESVYSKKIRTDAAFEVNAESNLCVKASMVTELVEMGFSLEAIERILNLKPEVLDRLL